MFTQRRETAQRPTCPVCLKGEGVTLKVTTGPEATIRLFLQCERCQHQWVLERPINQVA